MSRPASRCSRSHPTRRRRTDRRRLLAAATGATPDDVCPATPVAAAADGAADGRRGARPAAVHDRRPRRRSARGRRRRRTPVLVETAGGVRSPIADRRRLRRAHRRARRPAVVVLVADAGLGTINLVRLSRDALLDAARRGRLPQPLRRSLRSPRTQRATGSRTREGLDVVTDVEALATFVEHRADGRTVSSSAATRGDSAAVLPSRSVIGPIGYGVARGLVVLHELEGLTEEPVGLARVPRRPRDLRARRR